MTCLTRAIDSYEDTAMNKPLSLPLPLDVPLYLFPFQCPAMTQHFCKLSFITSPVDLEGTDTDVSERK